MHASTSVQIKKTQKSMFGGPEGLHPLSMPHMCVDETRPLKILVLYMNQGSTRHMRPSSALDRDPVGKKEGYIRGNREEPNRIRMRSQLTY